MSQDWTQDWIAFTDKFASIAQHGQSAELVDTFSGVTVRWHGVLTAKNLSESPMVEIHTTEVTVDLGDGRTVSMWGFALPVANSEVASWSRVPVGSQVRFEAQFVAGLIPFSAVEVKTLSSGLTLVMLRLTNGRVLEHGD